jgi:SNF2 family DNA or RNA helicase
VADGDFAAMRRATAVAEPGARSGKLDRLEELLVDHVASGRKVVVFSCFDEVLAAIDERFGALGRLTRETTPKDRAELVDAFRGIPGHTLLLCHVEMAAQGLNLQCATAVVLVEPQLEPTSEDHAVARAHRMGQTQAVLVHRLLAYDTLDEHLAARLARRRELFDAFTRETSSGASETAHAAFASEVIEKERERLELRSAAARRQG